METNYKLLCEQRGKMLDEYQTVIVPGLRSECQQLRTEVKQLKDELVSEKYRHDRQADFIVGQGKVMDDLRTENAHLRKLLELARGERDVVTRRMIEEAKRTTKTYTDRIGAMSDEELEQAEKDGRLFISPVKVGDMLWPICFDTVLGAWVVDDQPQRVNEVGTKGFFVSETYGKPEDIDEFYPYELIGDEYFHTREEAVAAVATKERPEEVRDEKM